MFKVMISVDGSDNSARAVKFIVDQAPLYKAPVELHLLNVQSPVLSGNIRRFIGQEEINKYCHDEATQAMAPARKILDDAKVPYTYHIGVGDIAETVAQYVRDKQCDQVIMGTRGMGSISNMLLGSVATKVIHLSEVPVLLVK